MNRGPRTPNQRPNRRPASTPTCPHCHRPQLQRPIPTQAPQQESSSKQAFTPLERIGITINNKLGAAFSPNRGRARPTPVTLNDLDCGDHICVERYQPMTYTHHGLYLGFGMVIHYDFQEITVVTIDEFSRGRKLYKVNSPVSYPPEMVMARAATRIGERQYNIMTNNCEHFVRWCRNGQEIMIPPLPTSE